MIDGHEKTQTKIYTDNIKGHDRVRTWTKRHGSQSVQSNPKGHRQSKDIDRVKKKGEICIAWTTHIDQNWLMN